MQLKKLISLRRFRRAFPLHIVYEWEDEVCKVLGLPIVNNYLGVRGLDLLYRRVGLNCSLLRPTFKNALCFIMEPDKIDANIAGKSNIIPVIIDFWCRDAERLRRFEYRYAGNKAVLVTSREAFEWIQCNCPRINAYHWPLSLPSKYLSLPRRIFHARPFDCVCIGRQNSVMADWLRRYHAEHSDFVYVVNKRCQGCLNSYVASNGQIVDEPCATRDSYFRLLQLAKIGLYATPGIDSGRADAKGFNQVTPRFLEYLAAGCHVISRYVENADTHYYELNRMSPHCETYDQFASRMDYARSHDVNRQMYDDYLAQHSTVSRIALLQRILGGL